MYDFVFSKDMDDLVNILQTETENETKRGFLYQFYHFHYTLYRYTIVLQLSG